MSINKQYKCEIEWESEFDMYGYCCEIAKEKLYIEKSNELSVIIEVINWMQSRGIDSSNLMYCRVEEVFDSEMRTNVLLWIGE